MDKIKAKHTEISVLYNLPDNWAEETAFSFEHLSELVLQLHDSAYSATVKAINRFATIRNYVIGFYIVEYEQHGNDRATCGPTCAVSPSMAWRPPITMSTSPIFLMAVAKA